MTKTILALTVSVLALGATPAFAGGCCGGVPAPVQRMMLNVSGEAAPAATTEAAPEAAVSEETPAPEAIAPASGEAAPAAEPTTEAPAAEAAPVDPEAVEDAAQ